MKSDEKIFPTQLQNICGKDRFRICRCWNILRTCTDEQLVSLEKQVDAMIENSKNEESDFFGRKIGVNIGPELPF